MEPTEKCNTFEWVADPEVVLQESLSSPQGQVIDTAVDLGCGTSTLATTLAKTNTVRKIFAIDRDQDCIAHMQKINPHPRVEYVTHDLTNGPHPQIQAANVALDKGMLDCAIVEATAGPFLRAVEQMLAPSGKYILVSFRKEALISQIFACENLNLTLVRIVALQGPDGGHGGFLCELHKSPNPHKSQPFKIDNSNHVDIYLNNVLDTWYREEMPYLTAAREASICENWHEAAARARVDKSMLPLSSAFEVLLTKQERTEVTYEDFCADMVDFIISRERDGSKVKLPKTLDLDTALQFIAFAQ